MAAGFESGRNRFFAAAGAGDDASFDAALESSVAVRFLIRRCVGDTERAEGDVLRVPEAEVATAAGGSPGTAIEMACVLTLMCSPSVFVNA